MTQQVPPAAPTSTPYVPPHQPDLSDAHAAANARLAEALPGAPAPGDAAAAGAATVPLPPADPDVPFDLLADNALENMPGFDQLAYRDGKKLEKEIARTRDTYKPIADAFGGLDDQQRAALLASGQALGPDLAFLGAVGAQLSSEDRQWFINAMDLMVEDPVRGAQMLADGAQAVRDYYGTPGAQTPAGQPAPLPPNTPEWAQPGQQSAPAPLDPSQQPVTMAQLEAWDRDRQYQAEVSRNEQDILRTARELGYDPDSQEPAAQMAMNNLISMAGRPDVGGDLAKAHEYVQAYNQSVIDGFVQGKSADADRPGAPVPGAPPAATRTLVTNEDGKAAMESRLNAMLGPDPNKRASED